MHERVLDVEVVLVVEDSNLLLCIIGRLLVLVCSTVGGDRNSLEVDRFAAIDC